MTTGTTTSADNAIVRFFRSLADLSFRELVTPKLVKIMYVITSLAIVLWWLAAVYTAIDSPFGDGGDVVIAFIGGGIVTLVWIVFNRVFWEIVIILFQIAGYAQSSSQSLLAIVEAAHNDDTE